MRSATFATILGFAVYGSQATVINKPFDFPSGWPTNWPSYWSDEWPQSWPTDWFNDWFGQFEDLDHFPENPCEWVGGTCSPLTEGFCHRKHEISLSLPCSRDGLVGVGCCWHDPRFKKAEENKKEVEN
ncbi:hypothetical protein ACQKWADRAFT_296624 [Trichoderma austrokoningii]